MNDLTDIIMNVSGPLPHFTVFFTFACILGWWTKEFKATMTIMIVWSIGAEVLQAFYPIVFDFDVLDIWWNISGSAGGLFATQVALFVCSGLLIQREKGWDEIRRKVGYGNYT